MFQNNYYIILYSGHLWTPKHLLEQTVHERTQIQAHKMHAQVVSIIEILIILKTCGVKV